MLDIALAPLALTAKNFPVGSTIRVTVNFAYTVGADTKATLKAGPYYTNAVPPFKHLVDSCVGSADVSLAATTTPAAKTATVDFLLIPKFQGGIEDGSYGLRVWVEGTNALAEQDNVIIVSGNPASEDTGVTGAKGILRNIGIVAFTGLNLTIGSSDTVLLSPSLLLGRKRQAPPLTGLSTGDAFQIMCNATNTLSASPVQFSLHWKVTKPSKKVLEGDNVPSSPTAAGKSVDFTDPPGTAGNQAIQVNETGDWTLALTLKTLPGNTIVDTYEAVILKGVAAGTNIGNLLVLVVMIMMMNMLVGLPEMLETAAPKVIERIIERKIGVG